MVVAVNPKIMGRLVLSPVMVVLGWLATLVMAVVTVGFFVL